MESIDCRFCGQVLSHTFVDLGMSPLSNAFLKAEQLNDPEPLYPLHAFICENCFLVQLQKYENPGRIFSQYAYFSSYSDSWLKHASDYSDMIIQRLGISSRSLVIEIASNDGYLLHNFVKRGIPVLGIEPASNVAMVAQQRGIPTLTRFFGKKFAGELVESNQAADLVICNNVLAHVPDLNDFVAGIEMLLKPGAVVTIEFPHLMRLIDGKQFDTIYHEHFSYFSLTTVERVLAAHDLTVFDVEELATHGGSLRVYATRTADCRQPIGRRVARLRRVEEEYGLMRLETYVSFGKGVERIKDAVLDFLNGCRSGGKRVVGYGAPAKGNTLLNYCGVDRELLQFTVDRSPHKQGLFLPGSHIPILPPEAVAEAKPGYLLILPWNLKEEIMEQMAFIRNWGGRFVVAIPTVEVIS